MATVNIPEGFVLVTPRSREVATALLDAVAKVKGDRVADVRTVTGGYHVREEVAAKYQQSFPDAEVEEAPAKPAKAEADEAPAEKSEKDSEAKPRPRKKTKAAE